MSVSERGGVPANPLLFMVHIHLKIFNMHFDCMRRRAESAGLERVHSSTALVVVPCACLDLVSLLVADARETSCFGGSKLSCRQVHEIGAVLLQCAD